MFIISLHIAVIAVVWVFALTKSEGIFGFVPGLVGKLTQKEWIHKITYECEKCIAGQIAFWFGIFSGKYTIYEINSLIAFGSVVVWSIFFAMILGNILNKF